LVGLQPAIILTGGTPATIAIQRETRTIPIVFVSVVDPVASGIVPQLNRPGANITGFAAWEPTLAGKWLELLSEVAPGLKRATIMFNPDMTPASAFMPSFETGPGHSRSRQSLPPFIAKQRSKRPSSPLRASREAALSLCRKWTIVHRAPIVLVAARNNVPTVSYSPFVTKDGGLLSYGADTVDLFRRAASYVDRILRGVKPGDLPVQFPTKYEMVVNLKTAKALGLAVPQSILLRADEVIE
jgi:putative ABC transport system substrate-binding protein